MERFNSRPSCDGRLAAACAAMHVSPEALKCETTSRLDRICAAAAVELGKKLVKNEAQLRADYDLTLREIVLRLRNEKSQFRAQAPSELERQQNQEGTE